MTRLWLRVYAPAALLYAGPVLAGGLGTPGQAVWVFAALFLAHMVMSGHGVTRKFRADSPAAWAGFLGLATVQLAIAAAVFFGAGAAARALGAAAPGGGPLWPVLVSAAALRFSWRLRKLNDPEITEFLNDAAARVERMSADLHALDGDTEAWAQRDAERTAQERAELAVELERAEASPNRMGRANRDRLVGTLAQMHIETDILDALTARVADLEWRRLRQEYLGHPDVMGFDFDMTDFIDLFVEDLALLEIRDRAAETALRWFGDLGWERHEIDRVRNAALQGPQSEEIDRLIAELEPEDVR